MTIMNTITTTITNQMDSTTLARTKMNMTTNIPKMLTLTLLLFAAAACSQSPDQQADAHEGAAVQHHDQIDVAQMVVHKSPQCGCCTTWAEQAEAAGFEVEMRETDTLNSIKEALGVPRTHASCHTAKIGGYYIEGHVPFDDIKRLLSERPDARGLSVPGMPLGSPGMEQGNRRQAYDVYLIDDQGNASVYNHYPAK